MMKLLLPLVLLSLCLSVFSAEEEKDSLPHVFTKGDTARAASVNENFTYLLEHILIVQARIDSLEDVTASMSDSIAKLRSFSESVPRIDSIASIMESLNDSVANLQNLRTTASKLDSLADVTTSLNNSIEESRETITEDADRIDSLGGVVTSLNGSISDVEESTQQNAAGINDLEEADQLLDDALTTAKNNLDLPIGTIIGSMLAPDQFAAQFPGDSPCWKLADSSSANTEFRDVFNRLNLPDLRGVFLRGINEGRSGGFTDPDGEREAGETQSFSTAMPGNAFTMDSAGAHVHSSSGWGDSNEGEDADNGYSGHHYLRANNSYQTVTTASSGKHLHSISGGDDETRPGNVAVYWYIKVK